MRMKNIIMALVLLVLIGMGGCATTGDFDINRKIGYEKFFDSYGNKKLVLKGNDLYLEDMVGNVSKQITHTPDIKEGYAIFSKEGDYIAYTEDNDGLPDTRNDKKYIIRSDGDDSERKEISLEEISHISSRRKGYLP